MSASNFGVKTSLHLAAEDGNVAELRALLEAGVHGINNQDNPERLTPLMLACAYPGEAALDMAIILVKAGADINLFDKDNISVLMQLSSAISKAHSRWESYREIDALLREQVNSLADIPNSVAPFSDIQHEQDFWKAILDDEVSSLERFDAANKLSAIHPGRGLTPLQLAIEERSIGCLKKLLDLGANPKEKNPREEDAFQIMKHCLDKAQLYIEKSVPLKLEIFYHLLRERKPHDAALNSAIQNPLVLGVFNDEQSSADSKNEALSEQLSILLGISIEDMRSDYNSGVRCGQYEMHLRDWIETQQANFGLLRAGRAGMTLSEFLRMRIRLYLRILMEGEMNKWTSLPRDENEDVISRPIVLEKLRGELLADLEIYWQEKARQACVDLSVEYHEQGLKSIAENIIQQCKYLSREREYSFYSGYQLPGNAHCIYISLEKVSEDSVIVRVDNRWTQANQRDGQYHLAFRGVVDFRVIDDVGNIQRRQQSIDYLQPYYIGHFKLTDEKLKMYLTDCLKALSSHSSSDAMQKIYPWPLARTYHSEGCVNMMSACLVRWLSQPRQPNEMGNCVMSNHNYGVDARLGPGLSAWLFEEEGSLLGRQIGASIALFRRRSDADVQARIHRIVPEAEREEDESLLIQENAAHVESIPPSIAIPIRPRGGTVISSGEASILATGLGAGLGLGGTVRYYLTGQMRSMLTLHTRDVLGRLSIFGSSGASTLAENFRSRLDRVAFFHSYTPIAAPIVGAAIAAGIVFWRRSHVNPEETAVPHSENGSSNVAVGREQRNG